MPLAGWSPSLASSRWYPGADPAAGADTPSTPTGAVLRHTLRNPTRSVGRKNKGMVPRVGPFPPNRPEDGHFDRSRCDHDYRPRL